MDAWPAELARAFDRGAFVKLTLGDPVPGAEAARVLVRPVALAAGPRLQVVTRLPQRDVTRNFPIDEGVAHLVALVPDPYRSVHLATTDATIQARWDGRRWRLTRGPPAHDAVDLRHDRAPRRAVAFDRRWIDALGGGGKSGTVEKQAQIERFVEVLAQGSIGAPGRARFVDVGSGSGALTYALWSYLRSRVDPEATVVGVELRPELASRTEAIARGLGCDGLRFVAGGAESVADGLGPIDGVVALHACDTATDDALFAGIQAGARWLLVAPCCHKELRPRLQPIGPLAEVMRHGILRTRTAEIATDTIRAAALEAVGYDARVFEFVASAHTDKNVLVTGVLRGRPLEGAAERLRAVVEGFGLTGQHLVDRLEGVGRP